MMKSEIGEFGMADSGHQWDEAEDEQQKMLEPEPEHEAGTRASYWVRSSAGEYQRAPGWRVRRSLLRQNGSSATTVEVRSVNTYVPATRG